MLSKKTKLIILFLMLVLSPFLAAAGDEAQINQALKDNVGGVYTLPAGTYTISSTVTVPEGTTFQGTTGANGELLSEIVLSSTANLAAYEPLIDAKSNTRILYLSFDANSMNQKNVPDKMPGKQWGGGYDNIIRFQYGNGLEVAYCEFQNSLGDGVRCINSENIDIHDNKAWKLGHDAFFCIRSEGVRVHDNYVQPRVNAAVRFNDVNHGRIYNNSIKYTREYEGIPYDAGPDIQLEHDTKDMQDIEVCNNVLYESCGPGIWIIGGSGSEEMSIHHNLFMNPGSNHGIDWVGGIVFSGFNNIEFKNNCFDGSYVAAINFFAGSSQNINLDSNIFTNSRSGGSSKAGGYGIYNRVGAGLTSVNNCYWNNAAGNTWGCSVSGSDISTDPKIYPNPSGWKWVNNRWECGFVKPLDLGNYTVNNYDPITEEQIQKMNNIFDILKMDFSDTGRTEQKAEDIPFSVQQTEHGAIMGGVKILGFKDLINIDNISYIPDNESILYKAAAVRAPSFNWWDMGVSNISQKVTTKIENRTAYAVLTVKMEYYTITTNKITGKTKKNYKISTAVFNDSCPAPEVLQRPAETKAIITYYNNSINPHTLVYVPSQGLVKVNFEYSGNTSEHVLMIGEKGIGENGVQVTNFSTCDYCRGSIPYQGEALYISGSVDHSKLNITCFTPYESFKVTKFEYIEKAWKGKSFSDLVLPFVLKLGVIFFFLWQLLKIPFS